MATRTEVSVIAPQHRKVVVERLHRALVAGERLPRSTLSAETRLSGGLVGSVLDDLEQHGLVRKREADEPGVRGPKTRYELNAERGHALAIGFGHDRLGVAVTDLAGRMLPGGDHVDSSPSPFSIDEDPTGALARASGLARHALEEVRSELEPRGNASVGDEQLVGIGVSLPAPLMRNGRLYRGFMDAWQSRNVAGDLKRLLDLPDHLPVEIENDANLIAVREHRRGAARGATHACVVKWGAGVGAGLILDDRLYRGPRGLAGEIGHVVATAWLGDPNPEVTLDLFRTIKLEDRICTRCHQPCLEALINANGLLAYLEEKESDVPSIAEAILCALAGDETTRNVFRLAAHLLGHKLGPIVSALNLQYIVLDCFADPQAYELVVDGFREGLEHRMTPAAFQQLSLEVAVCGETASILGAADLVLETHLSSWARTLG